VDRFRRDLSFEVGTKVLLNAQNLMIKSPGVRKLWPKWLGPFEILEKVGKLAYRLDLPPSMKCHPVFYVGLLAEYHSDGRYQPPPPPVEVDGEWEFEVEEILDKRFVGTRRRQKVQYLVKWLGYDAAHNTWEPVGNLGNCSELIEEFELRGMAGTKQPRTKRQRRG
jgi:hypothetical protein